MALISSVYPYLKPELPNCPNAILDKAILDATRQFCRITGILRQSQSFTIVVGIRTYVLTPPTGMEVLDLVRVTLGGIPVPPFTGFSSIQRLEDTDEGETPIYHTWNPQTSVNLYPIPNVLLNDTLDVSFSYQPKITETTVPDIIFDRWVECISFKVKYMLMAQAGKAWSNPSYVKINRTEWYRLLRDALSESRKMHANYFDATYSLDQG